MIIVQLSITQDIVHNVPYIASDTIRRDPFRPSIMPLVQSQYSRVPASSSSSSNAVHRTSVSH